MVELAGHFVGEIVDPRERLVTQVLLVVCDDKLGPHFSGGGFGRSQEIDKSRARPAFEAFRDVGHHTD